MPDQSGDERLVSEDVLGVGLKNAEKAIIFPKMTAIALARVGVAAPRFLYEGLAESLARKWLKHDVRGLWSIEPVLSST